MGFTSDGGWNFGPGTIGSGAGQVSPTDPTKLNTQNELTDAQKKAIAAQNAQTTHSKMVAAAKAKQQADAAAAAKKAEAAKTQSVLNSDAAAAKTTSSADSPNQLALGAAHKGSEGQLAQQQFGVKGYEEEKKSSDYIKSESTVQGQLDKILKSNSPLMKQAEARGRAEAQAKGYTGSASAAAKEGQMINAALPIAQQDAATYARFAGTAQAADIAKDVQTYTHNLSVMMNQMNISSKEKTAMMGMFGALGNEFFKNLGDLNNNTDISAEDKKKIQEMYVKQFRNFGDLYAAFTGREIKW